MAVFGQLSCQPRADDLAHQVRRNLAAKRQNVSAVVLTAVSSRRFVITHRGAHARDFVSNHTRADAGSVDYDSYVARLLCNRASDHMRVVGIVYWLGRMSPEVLIVVTKIS